MISNEVRSTLIEVSGWLAENKYKFALVGGLAVSYRSIERYTKDVDFAIAISNDSDAENLIRGMQSIGYYPRTVLERKDRRSIATVRLSKFSDDESIEVIVDLLFATCGIEDEIVKNATLEEVLPLCKMHVATLPSLIAMKVLSASPDKRPQDIMDINSLLAELNHEDIKIAKKLVSLIQERKFNRSKDLLSNFDKYIEISKEEDPYFIEVKDFGDRFKLKEEVKAKSKNKTKLTKPKLAKPKSTKPKSKRSK